MSANNEKEASNDGLFSRKKSLLTVPQYASNQGISTGVVQECAKLGVVQVRKHKHKTFIVDLPLDACKIARKQDDNSKVEQIDTTAQVQRISEMVNKIFQPVKQAESVKSHIEKPVVNQASAIPDLNLFAQEENKASAIDVDKLTPIPSEFKVSFGRKIIDMVKIMAGRKTTLTFISITVFLFAGFYTWTTIERKSQQQKLQQAYENVNKLINEYEAASRKAKLYEMDSTKWRTESQRSSESIANLEIELIKTKEKLTKTQESLSEVQQNHVDTLKKLNEQINEITSRIKQTPVAK